MNAIAERWIGGCRRELLDRTPSGTRLIFGESWASTAPTTISTGLTVFLNGAAPLKPLPEPVDLDLCRIRKHAQVGGLINEYHLVA
jgi:hypothetical protein